MHIHTLRHTPPFSQPAYTNSKPKISWNNAFSVKPKRKNSQPSLRKLSSSTDVLMHAHTQLMTGIIFIKNWQSWGFVSVVCGLIYMLFADQFLDWYPSVVFWSVSLLFVDRCICGLLINVSVVCGLIDLWFADQRFCGLWTDVSVFADQCLCGVWTDISVVCWSMFVDWWICGLLINVSVVYGLTDLWFADQRFCGFWTDVSVVCWSMFMWCIDWYICGLLINVCGLWIVESVVCWSTFLWFVNWCIWFADQCLCSVWTDVFGLLINVCGLMNLWFADHCLCGLWIAISVVCWSVSVVCGSLYLWFAGQYLWFVDWYICDFLAAWYLCGLVIAYSVMMHSVSQVFGRMFQIFLMFGQKCCALDLVDSFRAIQQTLHIYMTGMLPQKGDFFILKSK